MVLGLLLIGAVYLWCESKPTNRRILAEKMNEFCFILHSNLPINTFADQEICAGGSLIIHGCNACIYVCVSSQNQHGNTSVSSH